MKKTNSSYSLPSKNWFWILLITTIVTLGLHAYLTSQHYNIKLGSTSGPSICNVSATFNCDAVAASKYSAVFNIPIALLGFMAQSVLLIFLLTAQFSLSEYSATVRRTIFWLAALIALVSIAMGLISLLKLGTYCLFCIATYALSFISFFAAWKFQQDPVMPELSEDLSVLFSKARWILILLIAIPALGWMGNSIIMDNYGLSRLNAMVEEEMMMWDRATPVSFSEQGLVHKATAAGRAKMTIVEFADFLCPHCKSASPTLDAFVSGHSDVTLIFKAFPLDGKCNKAITHVGDGFRCQLAAATICAQNMGQLGWKAHHWIFEQQEKFLGGFDASVALTDLAQYLALDPKEFKKCAEADATYEAIQAGAKEGELAKIEGTPSIFVNGKKLQRGQFLPVLQRLYEKVTGN